MAHGAWSWWIGPFLVGLAAAQAVPSDVWILLLTALASFLVHQPAMVAVKALSGRAPKADLRPALFWMATYGLIAFLGVLTLFLRGHTRFIYLAGPGLPVFAWHLLMVRQKAERRQWLVEVLAATTLALWAPAAYWVAGGQDYPEPWFLWVLCAMQSAGAILTVYLRLEQRRWKEAPDLRGRVEAGRTTLLWHAGALFVASLMAWRHLAPWLVVPAYALALADAAHVALAPRLHVMPRQIGIRQLVVTSVFVALLMIGYLTR